MITLDYFLLGPGNRGKRPIPLPPDIISDLDFFRPREMSAKKPVSVIREVFATKKRVSLVFLSICSIL